MVTIIGKNVLVEVDGHPAPGISDAEVRCLSTDTKPTTNLATGATCVEVDTGNVYFFDSASGEWVYQFTFQT